MNDSKQSRQSSLYLMEENEGRLVYQASTGVMKLKSKSDDLVRVQKGDSCSSIIGEDLYIGFPS